MANIKFSMKELAPIVEELKNATSFAINYEDLWNSAFHKDGIIRDSEGRTEDHKDFTRPASSNIDETKVLPCLWLVKDHGLYIMSNKKSDKTDTEDKTVTEGKKTKLAYAEDCNPDKDEWWYEEARAKFGGDDGCISIPLEWYELALQRNNRKFKINMTEDSFRLEY